MMLALTTATMSMNAQITMVTSNYNTAGQDTIDNTETLYWTTPVNALNSATSGKYDITLTETYISGTNTVRTYVIESTIDGTNWYKVHNTRGTDGVACDTLTTAVLASGSRTLHWSIQPGMIKYLSSTTYSAPTTEASGAGRALRLRVRAIGVTNPQSTKINSVKCLVRI